MKILVLFNFFVLSVTPFTAFSQDASRGEGLYKACIECHGEKGLGIESQEAPRISGQFDWYIVTSLKAFKSKERENPKMYPFIEQLSEKDFKDLAAYISTLK